MTKTLDRSRLIAMRRHVDNQRGSLLLVALLVMLALGSLGIVALNKANGEIRYTGNARRGAAAFRVAEGGAYTALAFTDALGPSSFQAVIGQDVPANPGVDDFDWFPEELVDGTDYFDMAATGSFGPEAVYLQALEAADAAAPTRPPMDFRVTGRSAGMVQPLVGYSLGGPGARCRFKYEIDTGGNVGATLADEPGDVFRAWQGLRSVMYIGPLPCPGAGG